MLQKKRKRGESDKIFVVSFGIICLGSGSAHFRTSVADLFWAAFFTAAGCALPLVQSAHYRGAVLKRGIKSL